MSKATKVLVLSVCLALLSPWLVQAKSGAKGHKPMQYKVGTTMENLHTLYRSEMNDHDKFMAYAAKADAEGYLKVAKLFRAIAKSEGMHAEAQAKSMQAMGNMSTAKTKDFKVGTTKKNLKAAITEVNMQVDKMLPDFIKQAEADKDGEAVKTFSGAKAVKANYHELLKQAAAKLSDWKADGDVYICKVCGNVVTKLDFEYCPVCKALVSVYEKVM